MTEGTDTTRADVEQHRRDLSRDVDALTDKVSPGRIVDRRVQRAKGAVGSVKEKVMGSASSLGSSASSMGSSATSGVSSGASSVTDTASGAVSNVADRAQGNPLAAGLLAFGAGWLVSSLLPASQAESQAAGQLVDAAKEHGQPVIDQAKSVGQEIGSNVKEQATAAVSDLGTSAQESAQHVAEEGRTAAQHVKDDAQS